MRDYTDDKRELTLAELEEYIEPLIHFGKIEMKVSDIDSGKRIEVFERDEYDIEVEGKAVESGDLTKPFTLFMNKDAKIGFIEHPYNAFTMANHDDVVYLIDLIGVKIVI